MTEDEFGRLREIEEALRLHYATQAANVAAGQVSARAAKARTRRRRQAAWLIIAAAVVLVLAGVVVVRTVLPDRPMPASPVESPWPPAPGWYRWARVGDAPIDLAGFTPQAAASGVYLVSEQPSCAQPAVFHYEPASDRWSKLPSPNLPPAKSCHPSMASHGDDLYLFASRQEGGPGARGIWRYQAETGQWQEFPVPGQIGDSWFGVDLAAGRLLFDLFRTPNGELVRVAYQYFDYATATWSEGELADPQQRDAVENGDFRAVSVAGRSLLLFEEWPQDLTQDGKLTLTTWDPVTNQQAMQTSQLIPAQVLASTARMLQVAEPGIAYLGPTWWGSDNEGMLVDLRDGRWSSLAVPATPGRLDDRYHSDASWVKGFLGDTAAGYVVAGLYLFNPTTGDWLAVPWRGLPPPTLAAGVKLKEISADVSCSTDGQCWKLKVEPLQRISAPITQAEVEENNRLRPDPWPRPDWSRWTRLADRPLATQGHYGMPSRQGAYVNRHYYDATTDQWHKLPELGAGCPSCEQPEYVHEDDLYVLVFDDDGTHERQLWHYRLATDSWQALPGPKLDWESSHELSDGLLLVGDGTYSYFDYTAETWYSGELPASTELLAAIAGGEYSQVRVDGRPVVVASRWIPQTGSVTLSLWDPVANQVREITRELGGVIPPGQSAQLQLVEPGIGYLGPSGPGSETRAWLVDLRDGSWSDLEVPDTEGPLGRRYQGFAPWAKAYFPDELAGYVQASQYLYNPTTQRWLALPKQVDAPPDGGPSEDLTDPITPAVRCLGQECWRWDVAPLETFAAEFTPSDVAESNNWRR